VVIVEEGKVIKGKFAFEKASGRSVQRSREGSFSAHRLGRCMPSEEGMF
jgi:hypothetical protein